MIRSPWKDDGLKKPSSWGLPAKFSCLVAHPQKAVHVTGPIQYPVRWFTPRQCCFYPGHLVLQPLLCILHKTKKAEHRRCSTLRAELLAARDNVIPYSKAEADLSAVCTWCVVGA